MLIAKQRSRPTQARSTPLRGGDPYRRRETGVRGSGPTEKNPDPPLRILLVDRAGAQSIWGLLGRISQALETGGHEVYSCRWDDGRRDREDQPELGPRDHLIAVPRKRRAWDVVGQHRIFARAFAGLVTSIRPDVVHTNFIVPGGLAGRMARKAGVPMVVSTRHEAFGSLGPHLRAWSRLTENAADHVVCVSQHVAATYGERDAPLYAGGRAPRVMVIRNGIDLQEIDRVAPFPRPEQERALVVAGRMVAVKGQAVALEAFARVAPADTTLRLELVGDGPDRKALQGRAAAMGLAERVVFTGWRPRAEVMARMKSARAVLVPSDGTQEGFGLVLAEAMALRVPVVAADIPVFREVARLGSDVRLVPAGDAQALAGAILSPLAAAQPDRDALGDTRMMESYAALFSQAHGG